MNLFELVINDTEKVALNDLHFSPENKTTLLQTIKEHTYIEELKKYNLSVDNKILLHGHSGCGKTTTAKAIANALNKKIIIINLSTLIDAKIGETSKNLKAIFDRVISEKAVLFLDEFDQIGKSRDNNDKDVAEMKRLVNTLIQLIDYFPNNSLLVCATNYYDSIDTALLRRFQIKLKFEMPNEKELLAYYDKQLARFPVHFQDIPRKLNISYAEAKDYINTTMKRQIIAELELQNQKISETIL
ncbi:ATPase family protein associated with various cellular activities (AAA) [Flavobacterium sp. 90]|uniref:AAA family ATPase n=1 Tax=unclassified Flavobacterium TaxID=196869 RepID=UPI000EACC564|nr:MULTISPECIES: ATP-binding protein [unclassified Flavobacterium]RKR04789.1 ATPase family protein associated with various cellular activities (AAA) [Flavobacterium sp. 81]TCK56110.1 ATPase family protein associated with various cellular activities (AAA) [Flavobacterium sp. 90]